MNGNEGEAAEAEHEILNALTMAQEAAEYSDLEDRYSALALAEEAATEHGLMYVLPKYCTPHLLTFCTAIIECTPSGALSQPSGACATFSALWVPACCKIPQPFKPRRALIGKRLDQEM